MNRRNSLVFHSLDEQTAQLARSLDPDSDDWFFSKDSSLTSANVKTEMDNLDYGGRLTAVGRDGLPPVPLHDYLHLTSEESLLHGWHFPQMAVPGTAPGSTLIAYSFHNLRSLIPVDRQKDPGPVVEASQGLCILLVLIQIFNGTIFHLLWQRDCVRQLLLCRHHLKCSRRLMTPSPFSKMVRW